MNYSDEFKELVLKSNPDNHNDYIGKGNPNAKILIIGKELALPKDKVFEIKKTLKQNVLDWKNNIENPHKEIENWNKNLDLFNPLFPYRGMKKDEQLVGHTWRKYQLLHDKIYNTYSENYTFYNNIFITELNANPSRYSNEQDKKECKKSISERKDNFFVSNFIHSFSVVIVASGAYIGKYNVNLCELFNVDFKERISLKEFTKHRYYLHKNKIGKTPKLLIHCRQLSTNVPNELLEEIAEEIKSFAEENKIEL